MKYLILERLNGSRSRKALELWIRGTIFRLSRAVNSVCSIFDYCVYGDRESQSRAAVSGLLWGSKILTGEIKSDISRLFTGFEGGGKMFWYPHVWLGGISGNPWKSIKSPLIYLTWPTWENLKPSVYIYLFWWNRLWGWLDWSDTLVGLLTWEVIIYYNCFFIIIFFFNNK